MNKLRLARTFTVSLLFLRFCCTADGQQTEAIKWDLDFDVTGADKSAIEKLAKKMGIDVARVSVLYVLPSGGQVLNVDSRIVVEGRYRTWVELSICRKDWKPLHCSTKSRQSVERWQASVRDLKRREAWSIQDGDWHADVPVEPGIPFGDVEQIVLAIRHRQLVNRLPTSVGSIKLNTAMPEIDAAEITCIEKDSSGYEIRTGRASGLILRVRIVGANVEIYSYATWIV